MLGYPHKLYILPFDHRTSFVRAFIGEVDELTARHKRLIKDYKQIIFAGFNLALSYTEQSKACAILVDEDYGLSIIKEAKKKKIIVCLTVEKSGQRQFAFNYGREFDKHILKIQPTIVKALVRYNPANKKSNLQQLRRLARLSHWCHEHNYKFLLEPLFVPTQSNLKKFRGRQELYDIKLRPKLALKSIDEFHQAGVEPDIWKIEAFENTADWAPVIEALRAGERDEVAIILLGRGASFAKVKQWINLAPKDLLNGFAVGRTVFMRPLLDYHQQQINRLEAIQQIAKNYLELIRYWEK